MSRKLPKMPQVAYFEEYDEDANAVIPESRQVANVAAKRSKTELRLGELGLDFASDSGYSSRTAATVNSGQSPPSGRRSPATLKLDTRNSRGPDLERLRTSRRDKGKERSDKHDIMQFDNYRDVRGMDSSARSPLKPKRRESTSMRHPPTASYADSVYQMPPYYSYYPHQPPPSTAPPYDIPSSPKSTRYNAPYAQAVHISQGTQRRMSRSNSYHSNGRPLSYHSGLPDEMYSSMPMGPFEVGPPPSASPYTHIPYGPQYYPQSGYYAESGSPQTIYERSRPRDQSRRGSVYGPPIIQHQPSPPPTPSIYDGGASLERRPSREHRTRRASVSHGVDEDYYRMPPPPPPAPKPKSKPQIIQKRPEIHRKSATTGSVPPNRRVSSAWDMSDLEAELPNREIRKIPSPRDLMPERSRSMKNSRRMSSYNESERPARVAIEDARRRRTSYYEDDTHGDSKDEIEQKSRSAEEYQATRSGRSVPLTAEALIKAKAAQRLESDSGSQKSRSNSSRGSDARTRDGSGVGSKYDDEAITMVMHGVTMSFTQESVGGKRISVRAGDQGAVELNIEGRRPKKYLMNAPSDYTSTSGKLKEIEDLRRIGRDERRSDRASRHSSRSNYSGRGFD